MTIGERIVVIRGKMTQDDFGKKIGLTKASVSRLEVGNRNVTDRVISDICREFGIRREWLDNGIEPMQEQQITFSLDEYVKSKNVTDLELYILKGYMSLDKETRKTLLEHFQNVFSKDSGEYTNEIVPETTALPHEEFNSELTREEFLNLAGQRYDDAKKGLHSSTTSEKQSTG